MNIEQGTPNVEIFFTSLFDFPCSVFDIQGRLSSTSKENFMWQDEGFLKDSIINVDDAVNKLASLINLVKDEYLNEPLDNLLAYPAPGKWSKQQILGHLIDSAINNLKRFTEAQFSEQPYVIVPYRQNELVAVNNYQQLPINHLLDLWASLNRQIIFVVQNLPPAKLMHTVISQYGQSGSQTLEWLICDYVAHMQHHLRNG